MKKFFILLLFITGCGYQPLYLNKVIENLEFKEIKLEGDNNINNRIIKTLSIKENDKSKNNLLISSYSNIEVTSKNTKGELQTFRTIVNVDFTIKDLDNKIIQKRNFKRNSDYNDKKNNFELVEYQRIIEINLINEIIREILIFINS